MSSKRLDQGHIYLITNTINGKHYVGQTWYDLSDRWSKHCSISRRGCPYLAKAIAKHGRNNFTIESLARFIDIDTADQLETHYINLYHSNDAQQGYNLTGGGQGSRPPMSQAIRDKISTSRKGIIFSAETRYKMSLSHLNTVLSEDSQKRLDKSRARKRKLTMEQAEQIRKEYSDGILARELVIK